jgi:hypothetical protein
MQKYTILLVLLILTTINMGSASSITWYGENGANNFWNTDQTMWIEEMTPFTFWAQQWSWSGTGLPAYMGLQTNGSLVGNALFSAWNATGASGPNCGTFSGEGVGYHCSIPYDIHNNTLYSFRVWRLNSDNDGQWWGAWILNGQNGNGTYTFIGSIRINSSDTGINTPIYDWTENFGPNANCNSTPKSVANWAKPAFDYVGSSNHIYNETGYWYQSTLGEVDTSCNNGVIIPRNIVIVPYGI